MRRKMKKVISASRRTDMVAFFPEELSRMLEEGKASIQGPSGYTYSVDLDPDRVHTLVLWSKNFANLLANRFRLRERVDRYDQLYLHFTITGLGGTFIEKGVPPRHESLNQLDALIEIVGCPERVTIRFDPVVFWEEGGELMTNLNFFEELAPAIASKGIKTVRFSFAQWYNKAKRRAAKQGFFYKDPSLRDKKRYAAELVKITKTFNLQLYSCSQDSLTEVPGICSSACIDGELLQNLHPSHEAASWKKDRSQRFECGCTESVDVGSYLQFCPHCCLYCYANPRIQKV